MAQPPNVVLVIGAGASRNLAVGDKKMPLMPDLAAGMRGFLEDEVGSGAARAMGLDGDITGPEFERIIRAFLRWRLAVPLNREFRSLGVQGFGNPQTQIGQWITQSEQNSELALHAIRRCLFDLFGPSRIDNDKARMAYRKLMNMAGLTRDRLVVATTNYDTCLEEGFKSVPNGVHTGFSSTEPFEPAPRLDPRGMVERARSEGKTPVIHLHGGVGWYRQAGSIVWYPPGPEYQEGLGDPAILYPDPEKDPLAEEVINDLWNELDEALGLATHIVVIGHSLNDAPLVHSLARTSLPVAILRPDSSSEANGKSEQGGPEESLAGRISRFKVEFGPDMDSNDESTLSLGDLKEWLHR